MNALVELAKLPDGKYEGVASIARRINAPQNYLAKLLQNLSSRKYVSSQKGIGGGFRLGKDPHKITLYEIAEPIDNFSMWNGCALGLKKCSDNKPCPIHDKWKVIKEAYIGFLKMTTIADLIKKE